MLAEAGHLCQTFCLTATWQGLAPFCTMALADATIERALGIDGVSESVLYAAGAGKKTGGKSHGGPGAGTVRLNRKRRSPSLRNGRLA